MDIYDVVTKLVGPINPVGETAEDGDRFLNLGTMSSLVDRLLTDIDRVAQNKDRCEHSMKRAGWFAYHFMSRMGVDE